LAQKITSVPGSSDYFWGGWVTYDNRAKRRLGVTAATLRKEGAVSRTCAVEMAQQARRRSGGRVAMAITGIAGPDGGNVQKPLGRVYIALASNKKHRVWEKNFTGDRSSIREQSALWALYYLKEFLEEPLR
jgi:PncC family amidohydrolase